MKKTVINKPGLKLVGLTVRTNNKTEMNPSSSKIASLAGQFWGQGMGGQIAARKNPGVTFSVYTDYESNEHGDYTYFIGEEVDSFENVPSSFQTLVIPAAKYQCFTTPEGKMPEVVINAWREIWQMTAKHFEGERTYQADFEVYDERASNPSQAVLDIYIGIK